LIIGTRSSKLARTQTGIIADRISADSGIETTQMAIKTRGDIITDRPLHELEGRGYFTREIEEALLDCRIDIAVHSFKDMPSQAPAGLTLAAISQREDPADLLIIHKSSIDPAAKVVPLKKGAVIGTGAVRRNTQFRALRKDVTINNLRGNVLTRIEKLAEKQFDAIFLASAGVRRLQLELSEFHVERLDPASFVPSPGQGALAIQMRKDDTRIELIREIVHDEKTATAVSVERDVMARFGGGCSLPLGVYAFCDSDIWHVYGFWGENAEIPVWANVNGNDPGVLGKKLYQAIKEKSK